MGEHGSKWRGVVAVALLLGVAVAIFLNWPATPGQVATPAAAPSRAPTTTPLRPLQPLDRAALIAAAATAASAYAAGKPVEREVTDLAGRRFELVLPFGCGGPSSAEEEILDGWRFDAATQILQLVFPSSLKPLEPAKAEAKMPEDSESRFSKGFWIKREWLRDAVCPPAAAGQSTSLAPETSSIAIAELLDADAPRVDQRAGEPYRVSKRLLEEQAPDGRGLRIIVTGRLAIGERMPVRCTAVEPDRRPVCVILVRFDTVAVTDADRSTIYGEWRD
ncbi:MAG: hypothetical protein ABI668_15490 [Sphingorhabdus sp.]